MDHLITYFSEFIGEVARLEEWLVLLAAPVLLFVVSLVLAIVHAKRAYLPVAAAFGGAGAFLVNAAADMKVLVAWLCLYLIWCVLVRLLFLIPFRKKAKGEADLYERFHVPLELPEEREAAEGEPLAAENAALCLDHVNALLEELKKRDLNPADRLEADAIARTLEGYGSGPLTAEQFAVVNDSLAFVLKLTAKYKL